MRAVITTTDLSSAEFAKLQRALANPAALTAAAATAALPTFKRQFAANGSRERNRFGARSTFWRRMTDGTRAEGNAIAMPREMRLRVLGGTVKPVNGSKYLTLPLRPESYGKSIRQFTGIFFVRLGGRLFAATKELANNRTGTRNSAGFRKLSGKGGGRLTVLYVLATSVTIRGNRSLLPTDAAVKDAALRGLRVLLR